MKPPWRRLCSPSRSRSAVATISQFAEASLQYVWTTPGCSGLSMAGLETSSWLQSGPSHKAQGAGLVPCIQTFAVKDMGEAEHAVPHGLLKQLLPCLLCVH